MMRLLSSNFLKEYRPIDLIIYVLALWLQFSVHPSHAQNKQRIDSLTQVLEGELSHLERVTLFVEIAEEYAKSDSVNTVKYANLAIDLAREVKYKEGVIDALITLGTLAIEKGNYTVAMSQFDKIIELSAEANYAIGKAKAYRGIATIHDYGGKYEQALSYFNQSLVLFKEAGDDAEIALNLSFISGVKRVQGDYAKALEYGLESLNMYEKLGDTPGLGLITNDVGLIYWNLGELDKALEYFRQSIHIHEELRDKRSVAYTTGNIGMIYEGKDMHKEALENYNKCLTLLYELNDKRAVSVLLLNVGNIYYKLKQYDLPLEYYYKSLAIREELGLESQKSFPLIGIGNTYRALGQLEKARYYLNESYLLAQKHGMKRVEREALGDLASVESRLGNYKSAYDFHVLYKQVEDSLKNEEDTKRITRLEAEYEFQKEKDSIQFENEKSLMAKNTEIELLNEKEKVSRLRMLGFVGFSAFIITIGFFIARSKVRAKESQAIALREIGAFKEAMTGMIAHDLKNPLSIILNNKDVDKNQRTARQMLQLINNMLDVQKFEAARMPLDLKMVDLESLVTSARKQVEMLAGQSNIKITVDTQSLQVNADQEILERVLVNLLTNAIKYSPLNSEIKVSVREKEGQAELSVVDAGSGIAEEDQELVFESFGQSDPRMSGGVGSTGLGLTFCKLAVEAHGSRLDLVSDRGRGTTFSFNLDLFSKSEMEAAEVRTPQLYLTMSADEQQAIAACIPKLKSLNLYQISEIERELEVLKGSSDRVINDWVDAVLDAAYTGNGQRYEELLKEAERLN